MGSRQYRACKAKVHNRGVPPDSFLDELVDWGQSAKDFIFKPNDKFDVYSSVYPKLGPYKHFLHRKAVMLEVLRVLAGFESTWKWTEGRDITNSTSGTPITEETGAFQVSFNATFFDLSLRSYVLDVVGSLDPKKFIVAMKANHRFAIEFAARLLRFTCNHNGPVKRKEIHPYLSRAAVAEFESFLK